MPGGDRIAVLLETEVVGAGPREEMYCPRCHCSDRERLVYLYLKRCTDALVRPQSVLHVAPEPKLGAELRRVHGAGYVSADLADPSAMVRVDLMALCFPDERFDWIVCNHVLEHVPSDETAMRELFRVLGPGRVAILQVPIARRLEKTLEDPSVTSEEERSRRFGRYDHVRLYTASDYAARLKRSGFEVDVWKFAEHFPAAEMRRFGVHPDEHVFLARRPET